MGTFVLDVYDGWTEKQLKDRCRELCRASMHKDTLIALLVEHGIDFMPEPFQAEARRIRSAYDD